MEDISLDTLKAFYKTHKGRADYLKQYKKDYYNTESGRKSQIEASRRYYWRRVKKAYHVRWNPEPQLFNH